LDSQFGRLNYCKIQVSDFRFQVSGCIQGLCVMFKSAVHIHSFTPLIYSASLRSLRRSILTAVGATPLFWLCSRYALVMLWLGAEPPLGHRAELPVAGGRNPQRNPPYFTFTLPAFASSNCSVLYIASAIIQHISPIIA